MSHPEVDKSQGPADSNQHINLYDGTLIWPLLFEPPADRAKALGGDTEKLLNELVTHMTKETKESGLWRSKRQAYPSRTIANGKGGTDGTTNHDSEAEYAEFVYFHPFVREFLYRSFEDYRAWYDDATPEVRQSVCQKPNPARSGWDKAQNPPYNRAMRTLERSDIGAMAVEMTVKEDSGMRRIKLCLRVRRMELYLFATRVALLVVKFDNVKVDGMEGFDGDTFEHPLGGGESETRVRMRMDDVMHLHDRLRRVYPPFFASWGPGRCVDELTWLNSKGEPRFTKLAPSFPKEPDSYLRFVQNHGEVPCFAPWAELLKPLVMRQVHEPENWSVRQILDERMSLMYYLAVEDPRKITDGDWVRLALADDPGKPACYPYSPDPIRYEFKDMVYDMWWSSDGAIPAQYEQYTRYLCSGFAFGLVTQYNTMTGEMQTEVPGFSCHHRSGLLSHFRHHYFKMGLIAHFHHASLVAFENELARAVNGRQRSGENGEQVFVEDMRRIEREFFEFRSRYWFTEISNQFQAKRLFELWSRQLGNDRMFEEVSAEVLTAGDLVARWQGEKQSSAQNRLAFGVVFLTVVTGVIGARANLKRYSVLESSIEIGILLLAAPLLLAWSVMGFSWVKLRFNKTFKWLIQAVAITSGFSWIKRRFNKITWVRRWFRKDQP